MADVIVSDNGDTAGLRQRAREPEVTQLDHAVLADQNILRLNVAMNNLQ